MASKISQKHEAFHQRFDRLCSTVKPAVKEVARKAFEKNLISENSLSEAENELRDECSRTSKLLLQILGKVKERDDHFDTFVAILDSIPILQDIATELSETQKCDDSDNIIVERGFCQIPDAPALSCEPSTDFSLSESSFVNTPDSKSSKQRSFLSSFQCRCGNNCTYNDYMEGKCKGPLESLFPYLCVSQLSEADKDKLLRKLLRETRQVIDIFEDIVCDTFKSLEKRQIPIEKVRAVALTFCQQGLPSHHHDVQSHQLTTVSNVYDLQSFLIKHKYISFFNYRVLEKIIKHLGTEDDQMRFHNYLEHYGVFCKRSVFEVPSSVIDNLAPTVNGMCLVVKVNENQWFSANNKSPQSTFTMEDLYAVEENIASIIGLECSHILLRDVKKGCVELSFLILLPSEDESLSPLTPSMLKNLSTVGINVVQSKDDFQKTKQGESSNVDGSKSKHELDILYDNPPPTPSPQFSIVHKLLPVYPVISSPALISPPQEASATSIITTYNLFGPHLQQYSRQGPFPSSLHGVSRYSRHTASPSQAGFKGGNRQGYFRGLLNHFNQTYIISDYLDHNFSEMYDGTRMLYQCFLSFKHLATDKHIVVTSQYLPSKSEAKEDAARNACEQIEALTKETQLQQAGGASVSTMMTLNKTNAAEDAELVTVPKPQSSTKLSQLILSSTSPTDKVWKQQLKEYFDKRLKGTGVTSIRYESRESQKGGKFTAIVYCPEIGMTEGERDCHSKAAAEHSAAYNALKKLNALPLL